MPLTYFFFKKRIEKDVVSKDVVPAQNSEIQKYGW